MAPKKHTVPSLPGIRKGSLISAQFLGGELLTRPGLDTDDVAVRFKALGGRMQDLGPVLGEWGDYIVLEHIPNQFRSQGKPKRWKRLSADYSLWKRRHYGNLPILVLTGKMRSGFNYTLGAKTLRIRNLKTYWVYHQFGTRNMPARSLVNLTKVDYQRLNLIIMSYLSQQQQGGVL